MNAQGKRQSNVELLRIMAMIGVIVLHYIAEPGEILANVTIGGGGEGGKIYGIALINSICVCAVDLFIFISGYFMWKANMISIKKPVQLLTEVIIFQEITSLISVFSRQT